MPAAVIADAAREKDAERLLRRRVVSKSNCRPQGNRRMRRVLTQVANAAVKPKGSVFENRLP